MLRICPTVGTKRVEHQFNLEFRAADGTANPWLVMAAIIISGLDGLRSGLVTPKVVTQDFDDLNDEEREANEVVQIPTSLIEAITALEQDAIFSEWLSSDFMATYIAIKQREVAALYGATNETICQKYVDIY
jgi:glutamine synthetase